MSGRTAERRKPRAELPITRITMKGLWALLMAAPLIASGCEQRFEVGHSYGRSTALLRCSAEAVARADSRSVTSMRNAMRRLEACMAERHLPGYAAYDARSHAVRYAYEADQPHLRF